MDAFDAICEGLGLAIAAGLILGVVVPPIMPSWGVLAVAAPIGVLAAGAALSGADEAVWPAIPIGIVGAGLAAMLSRDVAAGAQRREQDRPPAAEAQAPSGVAMIIVASAVVVAGLSLILEPISLAILLALCWLWLSRRRRAARKHEGLRVLR